MSKGDYKIQDGGSGGSAVVQGARKSDSSFLFCILTLLCFLVIVLLIATLVPLVNWQWFSRTSEGSGEIEDDRALKEAWRGEGTSKSMKNHSTVEKELLSEKTTTPLPGTNAPTEKHSTGDRELLSEKTTTPLPGTNAPTEKHSTGDRELLSEKTTTPLPGTNAPTEKHSTGDRERLSKRSTTPLPSKMCETPACKSLSSRMLSLMDQSRDPCEDFFSYACGGMRRDNSKWILEDVPSHDSSSRINDMISKINIGSSSSHQKFKSFYEGCVNSNEEIDVSLKKVREVLSNVSKLYNNKTEWNEEKGNLTYIIGTLLKYHFSPLLEILVDIDSNNNSRFMLKLSPPVFKSFFGDSGDAVLAGWPRSDCLTQVSHTSAAGDTINFNELYEKYVDCMAIVYDYYKEIEHAMKEVFFHDNSYPTELYEKMKFDLESLLDVLVEVTPKKGEKMTAFLTKEFKKYGLQSLKNITDLIDWKTLVSMLLEKDVPEDTYVHVYCEKYFKDFFSAIEEHDIDERSLFNVLMALFSHELYYGLVVKRSSCDRENYCLKLSKKLMADVTSSLFIKSFDSKTLSAFSSKINEIFNGLITTLKTEIGNVTWMDEESRKLALEKAQSVRIFSDGGVSVYTNDTYLDSLYDEYNMNGSYLENAISLLQRYRKRIYMAYESDPSEPEQMWYSYVWPYQTSGKSLYALNAVAMPFGMMYKPYFSEDYPLYIQIAGLGHMIAHEIWHNFDRTGLRYGPKALLGNILSAEASSKMAEFENCFEDQYKGKISGTFDDGSNYTMEVNPILTLNERLADSGGTLLAYKYLWGNSSLDHSKEGYSLLPWISMTPQKLFFLSMAQGHCTKSSISEIILPFFESEHPPEMMRINGMIRNSQEFSEAFSCKRKSRCYLFTEEI